MGEESIFQSHSFIEGWSTLKRPQIKRRKKTVKAIVGILLLKQIYPQWDENQQNIVRWKLTKVADTMMTNCEEEKKGEERESGKKKETDSDRK